MNEGEEPSAKSQIPRAKNQTWNLELGSWHLALLKYIYPSAITRVPTKEKKIFLTFDDGPVPEVTPKVLSILNDSNAKATFFCIGENIEKHPDIFRQIISDGHFVGNHTHNHPNGWKTKTKEYLENVEQCNSVILKISKVFETFDVLYPLFRPPYGRMKLSQYSILNTQYSVVLWDVLSGDFDANVSKEKCLNNAIAKTRAGSIVVFHDSIKAKEKLFYVLPKFIEYFTKKGFCFVSYASSN